MTVFSLESNIIKLYFINLRKNLVQNLEFTFDYTMFNNSLSL